MSWIPAGSFCMGSEDFYPEEAPVREVAVDGLWMDEHAVTAAEYRRFVRETGYVTVAERPLDRRTTRTPIRSCSCRAHWSSGRPQGRCR